MKKTKIDWCDSTVNPVVGCNNGCPYCYARKLNNRFHFVENWNKPQFFPERLKQFESKTPKTIFVNSMSDIASWKEEWIIALLNAIEKNKQHKYIALTKDYGLFQEKIEHITETNGWNINNFFVGQTFDKDTEEIISADFVNIEPILEEINPMVWCYDDYYGNSRPIYGAIIVGAETGNRKGKVKPKKEWIDALVEYADEYNIPIFMKESLRDLMGKDFRQDTLLWDLKKEAKNNA